VLVCVILFGCASCSSRGSGKTIVCAVDSSPSTLDPQYADEPGAQMIINNTFEGLVRRDKDGKIINGIAKEWNVSEDGLVWTFTLYPSTDWYCSIAIKNEYGKDFYEKFEKVKVTAHDFEFACQRTVDPAINSPLAQRMMIIEGAADVYAGKADMSSLGVKALDDRTLEFRLTEKNDSFLERLTESEFMPCNREFYEATGGRYGLGTRYILGNGPFYVSYWDDENGITLKNNKFYLTKVPGAKLALPNTVTISFDSDEASINKRLSNGSLTAATLSPASDLPGSVKVLREIRNTSTGLIFNCSDPVTKNANIRKALCSSFDRNLFPGTDENIQTETGLVPASCLCGQASYRARVGDQTPVLKYDPDSAAALMEKGLKSLKTDKVSIRILCPERFDIPLREQLQVWEKIFKLNLSVSVITETEKNIAAMIQSGNFQVALGDITTDKKSAQDFLSGFAEGNIFRLNSKKYNETINRLATVTTEDEMLDGCFTAEYILLQQAVCLPLYSKAERFAVSKNSEGIEILDSESTIFFLNARRFD